jgi:hypothetical protein
MIAAHINATEALDTLAKALPAGTQVDTAPLTTVQQQTLQARDEVWDVRASADDIMSGVEPLLIVMGLLVIFVSVHGLRALWKRVSFASCHGSETLLLCCQHSVDVLCKGCAVSMLLNSH